MNYRPYCPWCRGPLHRTSRTRWTCDPCTALYRASLRDGIDPPWGLDPWSTHVEHVDEAAPDESQTFDGSIHPWAVHLQIEWFKEWAEQRRDKRERERKARIEKQILEALDRGIEPLLDRFEASGQAWVPSLFHEAAAHCLNVSAAESLLRVYEKGTDEDPDGLYEVGEWWIPKDRPEETVTYLTTMLGHITDTDENPTLLNDGGRRNPADHGFPDDDSAWLFDGHIVWLSRFEDAIQPGVSDASIARLFHAFLRAGAILKVNDVFCAWHGPVHMDRTLRKHVMERVKALVLEELDARIAAGYDLHLLLGLSYKVESAVRKLLDAGLSYRDLGPGAFARLVQHHPTIALDVLKAGLPRHVIDPDSGEPLRAAVDGMMELWGRKTLVMNEKTWQSEYEAYRTLVIALLDEGVHIDIRWIGRTPRSGRWSASTSRCFTCCCNTVRGWNRAWRTSSSKSRTLGATKSNRSTSV